MALAGSHILCAWATAPPRALGKVHAGRILVLLVCLVGLNHCLCSQSLRSCDSAMPCGMTSCPSSGCGLKITKVGPLGRIWGPSSGTSGAVGRDMGGTLGSGAGFGRVLGWGQRSRGFYREESRSGTPVAPGGGLVGLLLRLSWVPPTSDRRAAWLPTAAGHRPPFLAICPLADGLQDRRPVSPSVC